MKRDDLLSFGCGGNKVRKLQTVIAEAQAQGADALITCGGVQSNHARATAAAGAALGHESGAGAERTRAGAADGATRSSTRCLAPTSGTSRSREDRAPDDGDGRRRTSRRPAIARSSIPLGASTPIGALGFARGVAEVVAAGLKPTVIVHASSSGGTQAGLIAGCALFGLRARVIGVSADEPAASLAGS